MADEEIMQRLRDLRMRFPDDEISMLIMLQRQAVPQFRAENTSNPDCGINSTVGLDILIRVVRHLLSHLSDDHSNPCEGEEPNPLLRLAWADLDDDGCHASHDARLVILRAFAPGVPLREQNFTFAELSEHPMMHKSLLMRRPFVLFDPHPLTKGVNEEIWIRDTVTDLPGLARQSLVTWNSAQGTLNDAIRARFGIMTVNETSREYMWECSTPGIIRVRYNATGQKYEDFRNFRLAIDRLVPNKEEDSLVLQRKEVAYTLIACVRLRKGTQSEFLRLWSRHGIPIPLEDSPARNDKTLLGGNGQSYMLYFVQALPYNYNAPSAPAPAVDAREKVDAVINKIAREDQSDW
ncbi:hypothetical protein AB5N19_03417 [Seiridium cardinale]